MKQRKLIFGFVGIFIVLFGAAVAYATRPVAWTLTKVHMDNTVVWVDFENPLDQHCLAFYNIWRQPITDDWMCFPMAPEEPEIELDVDDFLSIEPGELLMLCENVYTCSKPFQVTGVGPEIPKPLSTGANESQLIPELLATDLEGAEFTINSETHPVMVLNFWATWCPPCQEEFPVLLETAEKYQTAGKYVEFYLISDEDPNVVRKFIQDNGYTIPENVTIAIAKAGRDDFQVRWVPTTLIVRDGKITFRIAGVVWGNWENELK